jgi:predicted alpha/beta superfamily hydrolase
MMLTGLMKPLLGVGCFLGASLPCTQDSPDTHPETLVPVQAATILSGVLSEPRRLSVYLPPDYSSEGPGYPVLYLPAADGDYLHFATGTARILAQFGGLPKMIVVGLRDIDGVRDLTPTRDASNHPTSGGADAFLCHIREEAIPFVESHYNTTSRRLLWGHSIVGTFAIYAFLSQPDLFQDVIASSPYLIYDGDEEFLLTTAPRWLDEREAPQGSLFFTVGDEDNLLPASRALADLLKEHDAEGVRWEFRHLKGEGHRTTLPETLPAGLRWVFSS